MIAKVPDGSGSTTRQIISSPRVVGRGTHDPWRAHMVGYVQYGANTAASRDYYINLVCGLKSGGTWYYISPNQGASYNTALFNQQSMFPVNGVVGTYFGLGYNFVFRHQLNMKLTEAAGIEFFNTH